MVQKQLSKKDKKIIDRLLSDYSKTFTALAQYDKGDFDLEESQKKKSR